MPLLCLFVGEEMTDLMVSDAVMEQAEDPYPCNEELWGVSTSIDIYDCYPDIIRSAGAIRQFVRELCDLIDMKRFGETQVVHFGEDEKVAGYSMMQLIETSLISAHFANLTNTVYLDVFSCKPYDVKMVSQFAQNFFGGRRIVVHTTRRLA